MTKKAVIICAGSVDDYAAAAKMARGRYVICADGGLYHAEKMGLAPDLIVGDFDSFTGEAPKGENVVALPREKDYSDTYTAALEAHKRGFDDLLFLAATGTRLDHVMANLGMLEPLRRLGVRAVIADGHNTLYLAENGEKISGPPGRTVSLVPLSPVAGLTLRGFKYPLENAKIELFRPIWISNELADEVGEITFDSGTLLIDIPKD